MPSEYILNQYYNVGGFNKPERIGFMMKMIRSLRPLTKEEWRIWYLNNVHDDAYLHNLAVEMNDTIPDKYHVSIEDCYDYICDVMFKRTFAGYNREKQALSILRATVSPSVMEAPEEWDTLYFIDFYLYGVNGQLIGIQLKPETFYLGNYQDKVDIKGKMEQFCRDKSASAFVLMYRSLNDSANIELVNPEVIEEIRSQL